MIEFIDKATGVTGTPINRASMMGIQGFEAKTVYFDENGNIIEANGLGQTKTTTFNADGTITEVFDGEYTITKTTIFAVGGIAEVIS